MAGLCEDVGLFEGPEKTLTISFNASKISAQSLRAIPQEQWELVLKHARCEILSVVESSPVLLPDGKKRAKVKTRGITAYLLSESSLFLSDTTLTLKTCGQTTPLCAMEAIFDLVIPTWQQQCPEDYIKYVIFTHLGYRFPEDQIGPHRSWESEVEHLEKYVNGDAVTLGSLKKSTYYAYVANYLAAGELPDTVSTQVSLTDLHSSESLTRFVESEAEEKAPLKAVWNDLHGNEPRCVASSAELDERFFEPIGYSSNAVYGKFFTTVHATPQPECSYLSIETSLPMTSEAKDQFIRGAQGMCRADTMCVTEFAMSPSLFRDGPPPEVPGFTLQQSSKNQGSSFACALHYYVRVAPDEPNPVVGRTGPVEKAYCRLQSMPTTSSAASTSCSRFGTLSSEGSTVMSDDDTPYSLPDYPILRVSDSRDACVMAAELILDTGEQGVSEKDVPVSLLDIGAVKRQTDLWYRLLPRVEPFYAVKCNPHPAMLETLSSIWEERGMGGFDCASPSEMQAVLDLGIDPADRIVYANPCKQGSALKFAKDIGVKRVVFDNLAELDKVKRLHPEAELLIRIQTDDAMAQCPLSNKFGALPDDCRVLFKRSQALGLKVVGVTFHVGSGCSETGAFRGALLRARAAFDEAEREGLVLSLLDIGGGFPGRDEPGKATFEDHAGEIRSLLEELFPSPDVRVIAEPGRFFAAESQAVLTTVVSAAETPQGSRYYLNDGLYGSFNCIVYDHAAVPRPIIMQKGKQVAEETSTTSPSTVFGPTCDGFDVISTSMALPPLAVGDSLLFPGMGAYTSAASSSFNGFGSASWFVYESKLCNSPGAGQRSAA
mmetsp:Transcript_14631/g.32049  ORF Transcript_14631/g.32049 Transcript_14631/m.32049 type:complete len:830 (-) Transcript_14631:96-2585(-)|eukprot:CAMPEP_0170592372 /NCGR_PEP_ID=MMETSP0224-20130122/12889_1 /TAXON_ID=285029 /ORGANISM="Togula jolla, Strain CCCM 725" /LENGTH=829 /DNA_ID=CAMNT_0010916273 /DNA_START=81 /DNA_END=2570 /DNA_ORIENTATION=-